MTSIFRINTRKAQQLVLIFILFCLFVTTDDVHAQTVDKVTAYNWWTSINGMTFRFPSPQPAGPGNISTIPVTVSRNELYIPFTQTTFINDQVRVDTSGFGSIDTSGSVWGNWGVLPNDLVCVIPVYEGLLQADIYMRVGVPVFAFVTQPALCQTVTSGQQTFNFFRQVSASYSNGYYIMYGPDFRNNCQNWCPTTTLSGGRMFLHPNFIKQQYLTTLASQPPTVTITASNLTPPYNSNVTLTWRVTGSASSCTASGSWSGAKNTAGGNQSTSNLTTPVTYSIQCSGPGGLGNTASVTVTPQATLRDLTPASTSVSSPTVYAGDALTLTANITNTGSAVAGPYNIGGFYIDMNGDGSSDALVQATRITNSTNPGANNSRSAVWNIPANNAGGTYRAGYNVDENNEVTESNVSGTGETNNWSGWTNFTVMKQPDLRITSNTPAPGTTLTNPPSIVFQGTVTNDGGVTKSGETIYADLEVDYNNNNCASGARDELLPFEGSTGIARTALAGGELLPVTTTLNIGSLVNGTHCYRFVVDRGNMVWEGTNEEDGDQASSWQSFTIAGLADSTADLIVTNPLKTVNSDKSITFAGTLKNSGTGQTTVGEQVWGDLEIDWNRNNCNAAAVGPENWYSAGGSWERLAPSDERALSATLAFAQLQMHPGTHCYRLVADRNNYVTESNDANNGTSWLPFTVVVPQGDINAVPTTVFMNDTTVISWVTTDTNDCSVTSNRNSDSWNEENSPLGGHVSSPITDTTLYTLSCDGLLLDSVEVRLKLQSIDATPQTVDVGDETDVSWNLGGQTGCSVTGGGLNLAGLSTNGVQQDVPINANTTFTLTCGTNVSRTTVEVVPIGYET